MVVNRVKTLVAGGAFCAFVVVFTSCITEKANAPSCELIYTWDDDIEAIVEQSCALSGCHVSGFAAGDFRDYEEVAAKANSGSLSNVIASGLMPPQDPDVPPISPAQRQAILCWVLDGAPEE